MGVSPEKKMQNAKILYESKVENKKIQVLTYNSTVRDLGEDVNHFVNFLLHEYKLSSLTSIERKRRLKDGVILVGSVQG